MFVYPFLWATDIGLKNLETEFYGPDVGDQVGIQMAKVRTTPWTTLSHIPHTRVFLPRQRPLPCSRCAR